MIGERVKKEERRLVKGEKEEMGEREERWRKRGAGRGKTSGDEERGQTGG